MICLRLKNTVKQTANPVFLYEDSINHSFMPTVFLVDRQIHINYNICVVKITITKQKK